MNAAISLIDRHVTASLGDKRAFEFNGKPYSYHDIAALANRTGNLLKSLGIGSGARVALLLPQSPAYVATLIGAMKIGAVPVVADKPAELSGASLAVIHQKFFADAQGAVPKEKVLIVGDAPEGYASFVDGVRSQASSLEAADLPMDAPALMTKGRTLSHRQLEEAFNNNDEIGGAGPVLRAMAGARTAVLS